jgi:hypothetical protein
MSTASRAAIAAAFSLFALTATPAASLAQQADPTKQQTDPERLKAAEELVAASSGESQSQTIQQVTAILWPALQSSLRAQGLDQQTVEEIHEDYAKAFSDLLLKLTREVTAQIMTQHFTTLELRELTAFESTPLARKYQAERPGIVADTAKAVLLRQDEIKKSLNASLQQILAKYGYCASHPKQCP